MRDLILTAILLFTFAGRISAPGCVAVRQMGGETAMCWGNAVNIYSHAVGLNFSYG